MKDNIKETIEYFRAKLNYERESFSQAVSIALQQRIFAIFCYYAGIPCDDLFIVSNRSFETISKMKDCLDEIETKLNEVEQTIKEREEHKHDDFVSFMKSLEGRLAKELDDDYMNKDKEEYETIINNVKSQGMIVYRNDEGKHKVEFKSLKEPVIDEK